MHARKLLCLLLSALLAVTLLAACGGSNFSKDAMTAVNAIQDTIEFETDSQLTKALQDALADNIQTSDVRDAMLSDQNLQSLLISGYRLDVFAVKSDSAKAAAESIAQNIASITAGKQSEGKLAMVLADNGYYYAAVLTWRDASSGGSDDDEPLTPPEVTGITVEIPEGSVAGTLNISNLTFTATYSNGTTKAIPSSDLQYSCTPELSQEGTFQKAGTYTLTITYDGKTFTETIEVKGDPAKPFTWLIDEQGKLYIPSGATSFGSNGNYYFSGNDDLVTLDLSGTDIESIRTWEFYNCPNLTTVIWGEKLKSVGSSAFAGCTSLKEVTINGTSDIQMDSDIFASCESLEKVTFAGNIKSIPDSMFYNALSLVSVNLGNIDTIGTTAFAYCEKLETVLGSNLTNIGSSAFSGCSALTNIDLSNAVSIDISAFYNCGKLTKLDLSSVETIGQQAFSMNPYSGPAPAITDVRFGEQVSKISNSAFGNAFADSKVNIYYGDGSKEAADKLQTPIGFNPYGIEVTWRSYEDGDRVF